MAILCLSTVDDNISTAAAFVAQAISPFNDVADVTTPTLIVCGEKDWNVPVQNSDQLYQALKRLGVETQLVVYPDEHHGISLPSFERDRYERWLAWFDKYTDNAPKDEEEAE